MVLSFQKEKYSSRLADDCHVMFLFHGVIEEHQHDVRNYIRKHILVKDFEILLKDISREGTALSIDEVLFFCRK